MEALQLPIDLYCALNRAAVIERLRSTQQGREYLEKAERLSITTIDADELEKFREAIKK